MLNTIEQLFNINKIKSKRIIAIFDSVNTINPIGVRKENQQRINF